MAAAVFEARMLASIAIEKRGTRFGVSSGIPDLLNNRGQTQWSQKMMDSAIISCRERWSLKIKRSEGS